MEIGLVAVGAAGLLRACRLVWADLPDLRDSAVSSATHGRTFGGSDGDVMGTRVERAGRDRCYNAVRCCCGGRPAPGFARVLTTAIAFVSVAGAALTRVNVFELMFHRIEAPASVSAAEAKLDPDDMVLAITIQRSIQSLSGPHARLSPHRERCLDGVPIAATY